MTNQSELLLEAAQAGVRMACPFCHGHRLGIIVEEDCPVCKGRHVYVECFTCGAEGPTMADHDAAVEAWQGRTP